MVGGMLGSVAGGMLGGLFGNKKKSVGPVWGVNGDFGSSGDIATGADNGADPGKATAAVKAMRQALDDLASAAGINGVTGDLRAHLTVMEEQGKVLAEVGGEVKEFTDQEEALDWVTRQLAARMDGMSPAMEAAVLGAKDVQEAMETLAKLDAFQKVGVVSNEMEQRVGDVVKTFEDLVTTAQDLGYSSADLADIEKDRVRALGLLRQELEDQIASEFAGLQDPAHSGLVDLQSSFVSTLRAAAATGVDLTRIEKLYGIKRLSVVRDMSDQAVAALSVSASALDQALSAYELQRRSIVSVLSEMQSSLTSAVSYFSDFIDNVSGLVASLKLDDNLSTLSVTEQYGLARSELESTATAAKSGDTKALSDFEGMARTFLEKSRAVNASGTAYQTDFSWVESLISQIATAGTSEVQSGTSTLTDVSQAQYLAQLADVDTSALAAALTALGLDPEMATILGALRDKVSGEEGGANIEALRAAYSQTLQAARARDYGAALSWRQIAAQLNALGALPGGAPGDWEDILERFPNLAGERPFATGGWVIGRGGLTDDLVKARLSAGEFVVSGAAAQSLKASFPGFLEELNVRGASVIATANDNGLGSIVDGPWSVDPAPPILTIPAPLPQGAGPTDETVVELRAMRAELAEANQRIKSLESSVRAGTRVAAMAGDRAAGHGERIAEAGEKSVKLLKAMEGKPK
jgi:hypothetical protein